MLVNPQTISMDAKRRRPLASAGRFLRGSIGNAVRGNLNAAAALATVSDEPRINFDTSPVSVRRQ